MSARFKGLAQFCKSNLTVVPAVLKLLSLEKRFFTQIAAFISERPSSFSE